MKKHEKPEAGVLLHDGSVVLLLRDDQAPKTIFQ